MSCAVGGPSRWQLEGRKEDRGWGPGDAPHAPVDSLEGACAGVSRVCALARQARSETNVTTGTAMSLDCSDDPPSADSP